MSTGFKGFLKGLAIALVFAVIPLILALLLVSVASAAPSETAGVRSGSLTWQEGSTTTTAVATSTSSTIPETLPASGPSESSMLSEVGESDPLYGIVFAGILCTVASLGWMTASGR